jgi:hypothetical protein
MRLHFSAHAVTRYGERVRPGLPRHMLARELEVVLKQAEIVLEPPEWCSYIPRVDTDADAYALIGDGILLPLARTGRGYTALTVLTRGTFPDVMREHRNERRREKRKRRRIHRAKLSDRMAARTAKRA